MGHPRHRKKKNKQNKSNKPTYKGPFQSNPNLDVQNVKKSMRPESEGPTVDTFSELDSTTNVLPNEENDIRAKTDIKRPTKEKSFTISTETLFFTIFGFVAIGIGLIVYNHSNKFVAVEKDIEYIQKDIEEQSENIEKIEEKVDDIDKNVLLIKQEVTNGKNKSNNR
jgi:cell division protein FtsL